MKPKTEMVKCKEYTENFESNGTAAWYLGGRLVILYI